MAKGKRDAQLESRWRKLLAAQRKSGLSVWAFCAREQVTEPSFYAWRREIRVRDGEKTRPAVKGRTPAFVPVMVAGVSERVRMVLPHFW